MREKDIEQKFKKAVEAHGGICLKLDPTTLVGIPDRLAILPGNHIAFIELKAPGKHPRPIQIHRHNQLRAIGCKVGILDNPNNIESLIHEIRAS
ncbi:VRR-NUC domain-containing protein [Corynebacterium pyruviciproducens]|nr:VRR-NUC domain-containing protein [Corynebacterium pyruviciproducens]